MVHSSTLRLLGPALLVTLALVPATAVATTSSRASSHDRDAGARSTLAATSIPAWRLQSAVAPPGAARGLLTRISCTSTRTCVAVGYRADASGAERTLIEARSGATWAISTSSDRPVPANVLTGVACPAARRCVAVGSSSTDGDVLAALTEVQVGAGWAVAGVALVRGTAWSELAQVACSSPSSCTAVGSTISHRVQSTLVETWDGRHWHLHASPDAPGAIASVLDAVSCPTARSCMAVGSSTYASGATRALVESWDGRAWRIVAFPAPSSTAPRAWSELSSVSCATAGSCVAVGDAATSAAKPFVALAALWSARTWRLVAAPQPVRSTRSPLLGVSCTTARSCIAVGFSVIGPQTSTLIERFDGTTWRFMAAPNLRGATLSRLSDVACTSAVTCTAAGFAGSGGHVQPLALTTAP